MSRALKHKEYLSLLSKSKKVNRRNVLIDLGNKQEIASIAECILNVLNGNIPLKKEEKKKMKRYKNVMRRVVDKKNNMSKKKTLLIQKGGFLPLILPLALSALSSVASMITK